MPSIEDNRARWGGESQWREGGDQWSGAWGGSSRMWHATIWPRIGSFLPAGTILEIAPGHGRVSRYLIDECERLILVDLLDECIEACRSRFAGRDSVEYHVNDGQSLSMVADASVDLCVSWDSLVHVEQPQVASYLAELGRVLRPGGVAFLHHSNVAAHIDATTGDPTIRNSVWRATSVSAAGVRRDAALAGLHCLVQEKVCWAMRHFNDCFSLLRRPVDGEAPARPIIVDSRAFRVQVRHARELGGLYSLDPSPPSLKDVREEDGAMYGFWGRLPEQ